jgi:hypothetical protein
MCLTTGPMTSTHPMGHPPSGRSGAPTSCAPSSPTCATTGCTRSGSWWPPPGRCSAVAGPAPGGLAAGGPWPVVRLRLCQLGLLGASRAWPGGPGRHRAGRPGLSAWSRCAPDRDAARARPWWPGSRAAPPRLGLGCWRSAEPGDGPIGRHPPASMRGRVRGWWRAGSPLWLAARRRPASRSTRLARGVCLAVLPRGSGR